MKTLMQFYLTDGTTHTDTHTDENKTQVNSKEPPSQGERRAGVVARLGTCTLEGGGAPWCGTCQWPCSSARSQTRGARVCGGTRAEQSGVPGRGLGSRTGPSKRPSRGRVYTVVIRIDQTDRSTIEERPYTTTHRLVKKLSVCQSSSYTELKTGKTPTNAPADAELN